MDGEAILRASTASGIILQFLCSPTTNEQVVFICLLTDLSLMPLVFEGPVGLQLWTIFGATATATGCQLRQLSTTATATGHNQLQPVATRLQLQLVVTGLNWLLLVTTSYN
jgi:hypothetical protein